MLHLHIVDASEGKDARYYMKLTDGGLNDPRAHLLDNVLQQLRQSGRVAMSLPLIYGTGSANGVPRSPHEFLGSTAGDAVTGFEHFGPMLGADWTECYVRELKLESTRRERL